MYTVLLHSWYMMSFGDTHDVSYEVHVFHYSRTNMSACV